MKNYFIWILIFIFCCKQSFAQNNYWQQQVNYNIKVSLNDTAKTLEGFETITYYNNSPDTLHFIWFHIFPNAYKNDRTAYAKQSLENGSTAFYFSNDEDRGYLNQLNFKVDNITALTEAHEKYEDVIKLILPTPLAPKKSIAITTPFFVKVPTIFSRLGFDEDNFCITQWYPKPAVYDTKGWHEMPYLDQGEFYSEFGNFEVQIILPDTYTVAATGQLQNADVLQQLKTAGKTNPENQAPYIAYQTLQKQTKVTTIKKSKETTIQKSIPNLIALTYKQENCHDFAWFASKNFIVQYDTVQLKTKTVDVFSFYHPKQTKQWNKSIGYAKDGIKKYSEWIGEYPYNTVSVVAGSENNFSEGMEYPTITLITTQEGGLSLDETIVHEIGHNWFYGALGSNEREHPWLDEGINTYYQKRYMNAKYSFAKKENSIGFFQEKILTSIINTLAKIKKGQPIDTSSAVYSEVNYFLSVYEKGSLWMQALEKKLGTTTFDKAMQHYYQTWQFKHPYTNNFKQSIESITGKNVDEHFAKLYTSEPLQPDTMKKKIKPVFIASIKNPDKYHYIGIAPLLAYNFYDKISIGAFIHNYQLPLNKFQFFVAPLYAFGSKEFNYTARAGYNIYKTKSWLEISTNAMKFTMDNFKPINAPTINQQVIKITPSVKYTLYKNDARSTQRWIFQAKSFFLTENGLLFKTIAGQDVVEKTTQSSYINRLSITSLNNRILYPYQFNLTIDQGKNFVRAGFTTEYFFNYKNRKGGINARLFAGKFFYTTDKTFAKQYETDRYHLNMSGAKGYEDYTYSNYFIGRNEFEGWQNQQIMQRDGFFKVRTDLLSNKIGKTDNWLMAINFNGNIPDAINILSALPIKIPIKFFVDIGTYAEAWEENPATGKFLYDAGLQVSLLRDIINIYVPLLYSKVYGDYFTSTLGNKKFWKNISFSIDIQKLQFSKIDRRIPL
ncbi:MAG: M1 family metallopeptidase [Chitinophagaceae bacterium]|nr:M1 family metallopeptidase [Chitinophagaceae bacterium]MCW5904910.1 M1 family metallopeptidase [Chitinophagaceae bacterium]